MRLLRGGHARSGVLEGDEEGVALIVDFVPGVTGKRFAQHPTVLGEGHSIALSPQLLEQARRPLDVREEERDRP